jgi:ATP-dependent 26S proteasome regulatory subunit
MSPQELIPILLTAGLDRRQITQELVAEAGALLTAAKTDPAPLLVRFLRARTDCKLSADAAKKLKELLDGLLNGQALLCKCEGVVPSASGPRALVAWQGRELRELPIHGDVDVAALAALEPWQWVKVHAKEQIVIGVCADADAFARSHGEVVEFKDWHDRDARLVRVAQLGGQEQIVRLARSLSALQPQPRDQLVLCREAPAWAIARCARASARSRFEQPLASLRVALDQVVGVDDVLGTLCEQIELRLLQQDYACFGLEPLHGVLLWSLQAGAGKTLLTRALLTWLGTLAPARGFELVVYVVKPNELKSMFHGEDARLVRDELCGPILTRQQEPRTQRLLQVVVMDELDALGRRAGGDDATPLLSGAHNDAIQALLAEMDGLLHAPASPPAHVLWIGLTNRPDAVDLALKRPGRFGDKVLEMPALTAASAEAIMAAYAPPALPCWLDGVVRDDVSALELRARLLRPALEAIFDTVVLRYTTDTARGVEVTAGAIMAAVRYREAMTLAKTAAARRGLLGEGIAAVAGEDVLDGLVAEATAAARELEADRLSLQRCLHVRGRVLHVDLVPRDELLACRDLRLAV